MNFKSFVRIQPATDIGNSVWEVNPFNPISQSRFFGRFFTHSCLVELSMGQVINLFITADEFLLGQDRVEIYFATMQAWLLKEL